MIDSKWKIKLATLRKFGFKFFLMENDTKEFVKRINNIYIYVSKI